MSVSIITIAVCSGFFFVIIEASYDKTMLGHPKYEYLQENDLSPQDTTVHQKEYPRLRRGHHNLFSRRGHRHHLSPRRPHYGCNLPPRTKYSQPQWPLYRVSRSRRHPEHDAMLCRCMPMDMMRSVAFRDFVW